MTKNPSLFGEPQLELVEHSLVEQPARRVQGGLPSTDITLSAYVAGNCRRRRAEVLTC